jgi:hypothetical protein
MCSTRARLTEHQDAGTGEAMNVNQKQATSECGNPASNGGRYWAGGGCRGRIHRGTTHARGTALSPGTLGAPVGIQHEDAAIQVFA